MNLKAFLFAAVSLLFLHNIAKAQSDTVYYDDAHQPVSTLAECYNYRVIQRKSSSQLVEKYYSKKHQLESVCPVIPADSGAFLKNGYGISYYDNGKKMKEGNYRIGQMEGEWKFYYYESGLLHEKSHYTNDSLNGRLTTYYPNGNKKREEDFKNGKSVGGKCFNVKGKQIPFRPYEIMPEFPGGIDGLSQFLGENIRYPEEARLKEIEGKVRVRFVVKKDGTLGGIQIMQGLSNGCNEEVIRVMKLMPKWIPGEQDYEKVDVYYTLPVSFRLD